MEIDEEFGDPELQNIYAKMSNIVDRASAELDTLENGPSNTALGNQSSRDSNQALNESALGGNSVLGGNQALQSNPALAGLNSAAGSSGVTKKTRNRVNYLVMPLRPILERASKTRAMHLITDKNILKLFVIGPRRKVTKRRARRPRARIVKKTKRVARKKVVKKRTTVWMRSRSNNTRSSRSCCCSSESGSS